MLIIISSVSLHAMENVANAIPQPPRFKVSHIKSGGKVSEEKGIIMVKEKTVGATGLDGYLISLL